MAVIRVNRAPVLTLWAAVVARHLGYDEATALTLGKALAGLNAQSKGRRLGLYEPRAEGDARPKTQRPQRRVAIPLMGRHVPALNTPQGIRAAANDQPINPQSVQRYLESKFGEHLPAVRRAMEGLAASLSPEALAQQAYGLYEQFRPDVPRGARGWGAAGELDLDRLHRLAHAARGKRP